MARAAPEIERAQLLAQFAATRRNHPYLAFTVNSICDRDCVFCKPRCVEDYGPKDRSLDPEDYRSIAAEAGAWQIRKAHISGGEPTLRKDIVEIIALLREGLGSRAQIGITTHGNLRQGLSVQLLHNAGLSYMNVSIHSLDPGRSRRIMGGGDPDHSIQTLRTALSLGLQVKVNCVLQRSYLRDAVEVLSLARSSPLSVRLIELQNIGPAKTLFRTEYIAEAEVRQNLTTLLAAGTEVSRSMLGVRSPGRYVRPEGWVGNFAFISNSSCATCSDANRIKITPTGVTRPCILHNRDIDLRKYIDDETLDRAFAHLFRAILGRDGNDAWGGFHYVDYDLRWDRIARPMGVAVVPVSSIFAGQNAVQQKKLDEERPGTCCRQ